MAEGEQFISGVKESAEYSLLVEEAIHLLSKAVSTEDCQAVIDLIGEKESENEGCFLLTRVAQVLRAHYQVEAFSASGNDKVIMSVSDLKDWAKRVDRGNPLVQKVVAYYNNKICPILANSGWMPSDYLKPGKWMV